MVLHFLHGGITAVVYLPRLGAEGQRRLIQHWAGKLLDILNVRVTLYGQPPGRQQQATLFVGNHISWLDIYVLKSTHPMLFVAKAEIRDWPVVGWLACKINTIFIERERRHATGRAMAALEQALRQGECLCFFPEGTTTDGTYLRPFKASLLQAAINAEAQLWPFAIRYPNADGSPNTAIAYQGEVTMPQSLWEVLKQRELQVELHFAAPLAAAGWERRQLAQQARHAISSLLHLPQHKTPGTLDGLPGASH